MVRRCRGRSGSIKRAPNHAEFVQPCAEPKPVRITQSRTILIPLCFFFGLFFAGIDYFQTTIHRTDEFILIPNYMRSIRLPTDVFFSLDVGLLISGVNDTGDGHIAIDTAAICQAYGAIESVTVNIDYTGEGRFTASSNTQYSSSDESDSGDSTDPDSDSTDPDYRVFMAGYDGSDNDDNY